MKRFKHALRLRTVAGAARVWAAMGGDPRTLARYPRLGRELLVGQASRLHLDAGETPKAERALRVTFFTMLGSHSYMAATDVALARALRARGHDVRLVLCDGVLPICENKPAAAADLWAERCHSCQAFGRALFDASGVDYDRVGDLAGRSLSEEDAALLGSMDFTYDVESSLFKCFRIGKLQGTQQEADYRRRIERSCELVARAALAVARQGPDRVVMSHGVYSTWAPALRIFNARNIPVAVYNKGKRKNTTLIYWARDVTGFDLSDEWAQVKDTPLSSDAQGRIGRYLQSRVKHTGDAMRYNFGDDESAEDTWRRLGLDPSKPTFVLFTNVLWDAASAQRQIAFPNAVDWVLETIDWFYRHPGRQLVVKIHPAEVVIGTNQPFAAEIRARFPALPANVRVIEPQETVNSWSIGRIATAGLIHTSTPGLELPLEGIPCIVVSKTHYRGKGFTIDVQTKDEYFDRIESWDSSAIDTLHMREYAMRYAYLLFERAYLPWDFLIEASNGNYTAFNFESDTALLEHPTVRVVVRAIEQCTGFFMPGGAGTGPALSGAVADLGNATGPNRRAQP